MTVTARSAAPPRPGRLLADGWRLALIAAHEDDRPACGSSMLPAPRRRSAPNCTLEVAPRRPMDPHAGHVVLPRRPFRTRDPRPVRHPPRGPPAAPPARAPRPLAHRVPPHAPRRRSRPPVRPRHRLLPLRHRRGRRRLRDPRRPRPRRPHRTRPLPVLGRRRDHPAHQGPTLVRPPRHREALRGSRPRRRHRAGRADQRRHRRRAHPGLLLAVEDALGIDVDVRRPSAVRALLLEPERLYNHVNDLGRHRQRRRLRHRSRPRPTDPRDTSCATTRHSPGTDCCAAESASAAPTIAKVPTSTYPCARPARSPRSSTITLGHTVVADRFTGTAVLTLEQATAHRHPRLRRPRLRGRHRRAHATHPSSDLGAAVHAGRSRRPATSWPASRCVPGGRPPRSPSSRTSPPGSGSRGPILDERSPAAADRRRDPARRARSRGGVARAPSSTASSSPHSGRWPAYVPSTRRSSTGRPCPWP